MSKFLLITAHPDDECMFFTPIIRNLIKNGCEIDLLCLSTGNFDDKGKTRKLELEKSSKILGIKSLTIIEDGELKDGPKNIWKPESILKHLKSINPDTYTAIITFDDGGVSGHSNHSSISEALKHQNVFEVHRLKSLSLWLKYLGCFGDFLCKLIYKNNHKIYSISMREAYEYGHEAMLQHQSQLIWFRRLYLIFSVYMTLNIFEIKQKKS